MRWYQLESEKGRDGRPAQLSEEDSGQTDPRRGEAPGGRAAGRAGRGGCLAGSTWAVVARPRRTGGPASEGSDSAAAADGGSTPLRVASLPGTTADFTPRWAVL